MSIPVHDILVVAVVAAVTIALRAMPFMVFPEGRAVPRAVSGLSSVLPCAVMGMLVVYCLKDITPLAWPHGLPEIISAAVTVGLHLWRRNTLLSILLGTACYIVLTRFVF